MSYELILPFLRPIEHLLASETINEIMVNPDSSVWIEEDGKKQLIGTRFEPGALDAALEVIANKFGKKLDADSPILNLRLPDGSRLAAMVPPVVHPHPLLTIRKFTSRHFTIDDLIARKMLTEEQAAVLTNAVYRGDNILISGGTATGKTTLLNVMADAIPADERIFVIEDTAELYIRKPQVVSAEAQTDTHKNTVTFEDLLKAALRHRPDRILLGEVRGTEARTLLDSMNTGHRGALTTIHAGSAQGALQRLRTLVMRGSGQMSATDVDQEIRSSIHLVAHIHRQNGERSVQDILCVSPESQAGRDDAAGNEIFPCLSI
ncbi:MAG: CpaF family protein [Acidobacteriaceae bacterium]